MKSTFKDEADFEATLVELLTTKKGWSDGVLKYPTEEDLVENWKRILFENNNEPTRLNGQPLTDGEMRQILEQVGALSTPERINRFINGRTVTIKRENPLDTLNFGQTVSLKIYSREEIAGGKSRYQIAVQPRFKARKEVLPDRRGDVVLLINGMPVIHIELKRSGVDVSQAVYQIEKYSREGVFSTGIFSMVQIFVAMNPEETLYFANPGRDALSADGHFNRKFMFHWGNWNNEPQNEWSYVAEHLLSIPMAHKMVGFYTVADSGDGILKVMRSYQYYAVSEIFDAVSKVEWGVKHPKGGYIWHTTGSGKTVTSFKAAQLIAASKLVDKVVFLVDRVELAAQSLEEYGNFANDDERVNETENTAILFDLLSDDHQNHRLIVTSIQKLSNEDGESTFASADQLKKINAKRIVVIVDECHRDTFGKMMSDIKKTFPYMLLFGFTGTPILDENKKKDSTTADVFGDELHRYSIADGIRDGNVLGFDPVQVMVYEDYALRQQVAFEKCRAQGDGDYEREMDALGDPSKKRVYLHYMNDVPMADEVVGGKTVHGIEAHVPTEQWQTDEYREAVVGDVIKKWGVTSNGGMFHALFAASSINETIEYYRLFKAKAPHLKVTALFDPNIDNNAGYAFKSDGLEEVLKDYNARYNKSFTMSTHDGFKKDVSMRLAHKDTYKKVDKKPDEQIDLLIVVDQMLTGFDSKWVNALYLDKVLEAERVIQAFSRTNRVFGPEKSFGVIRYYRKPHTMKQNIERAVALYSGDIPAQLFVPKLGENLADMNAIFTQIENLFKSCGIENFGSVPVTEGDCAQFARLFKMLSDKIESARVQGFVWEQTTYGADDGLDDEVTVAFTHDTYLVLATRYREMFTSAGGGFGGDIPFEIDTHLTSIDTGRIDSKYMETKFVKWVASLGQESVTPEETQQLLNDLHVEFAKLSQSDQLLAEVLIHDIQTGDMQLQAGMTFHDCLNEYRQRTEDGRVDAMVDAFGVDKGMLVSLMRSATTSSDPNSHGRLDALRQTINTAKAKAYFEGVLGEPWKPRYVRMRADSLLTEFVTKGDFDLDEEVVKRYGKKGE